MQSSQLFPNFNDPQFIFDFKTASPKRCGKMLRHFCTHLPEDPSQADKLKNEIFPRIKKFFDEEHPEMPARRFLRCLADMATVVNLTPEQQTLFRDVVKKVEEQPAQGCANTAKVILRNLAAVKQLMGEGFLDSTLSTEDSARQLRSGQVPSEQPLRSNYLLLYPLMKRLHNTDNSLASDLMKKKTFSFHCNQTNLQFIADFAEGRLDPNLPLERILELRKVAHENEIEQLMAYCDDKISKEIANGSYAISGDTVYQFINSKNGSLRMACYEWINQVWQNQVQLEFDESGLMNTVLLDIGEILEEAKATKQEEMGNILLLFWILHSSPKIECSDYKNFEKLLQIKESKKETPPFDAHVVHLNFHRCVKMDESLWAPFLRVFSGLKTLYVHCGVQGNVTPLLSSQRVTTIFVENPTTWKVPLAAYQTSSPKTIVFMKESVPDWPDEKNYVLADYPALLLRTSEMSGEADDVEGSIAYFHYPRNHMLFTDCENIINYTKDDDTQILEIHHPGLTDEAVEWIFADIDQSYYLDKEAESYRDLRINLSGCSRLSNQAIGYLLQNTEAVRSIDIRGCTRLTKEVLSMIKNSYPECKILHDFDEAAQLPSNPPEKKTKFT